MVNLILDLAGRLHLTLLEVLIHLQEELGHNGIGTSDAGAGAHGQTGDELLIGPVKNEQILVMPHLDILGWHGGVLHADHTGVFLHLPQQRGGQGHPRQLGDVVDDKVGVGGGGGDIIPVLGDAVLGQVEVDGRNGGDGVHPQALRVGGQHLAVGGVVACHVGDDNHLALGLGHHVLQHHLALLHALIDTLAGGTAHIQAVYALANQVAGQAPHPLR